MKAAIFDSNNLYFEEISGVIGWQQAILTQNVFDTIKVLREAAVLTRTKKVNKMTCLRFSFDDYVEVKW